MPTFQLMLPTHYNSQGFDQKTCKSVVQTMSILIELASVRDMDDMTWCKLKGILRIVACGVTMTLCRQRGQKKFDELHDGFRYQD